MSEPLALSLANAELSSSPDLLRWLRGTGVTDHADELSLRLADFLDLRSSVRDLFSAAAEGRPLPAEAVERVNEASGRVPRIERLESDRAVWAPVRAGPAPLVMAAIAWSAIELLGGPDRERVRRCGACGRSFVATRPDRVWCSDRCGNRIRVARHHARLRDPTYPVPG